MVIDTSVVVAAFRPSESAHSISRSFLQQAAANALSLSAPVIILPEAAAAFARGTGDATVGLRFAERLSSEHLIALLPVTKILAHRAAELAALYNLRGCDAVFVALAEDLGQTLITLDQEQLARGSAIVATERP